MDAGPIVSDAGPDGSTCVPEDAATYSCPQSIADYCEGGGPSCPPFKYEDGACAALRCGSIVVFEAAGTDGFSQPVFDVNTGELIAWIAYNANVPNSYSCIAGPPQFTVPRLPQHGYGTLPCPDAGRPDAA